LDIDLKDNIVIVDEAHNIIDAINQIHSVDITITTLNQVTSNKLGLHEHLN
jgi:chromosome transmission fidelity protein 1